MRVLVKRLPVNTVSSDGVKPEWKGGAVDGYSFTQTPFSMFQEEAQKRMLAGKRANPTSTRTEGQTQTGSARSLAAKQLGAGATTLREAAYVKEKNGSALVSRSKLGNAGGAVRLPNGCQ